MKNQSIKVPRMATPPVNPSVAQRTCDPRYDRRSLFLAAAATGCLFGGGDMTELLDMNMCAKGGDIAPGEWT
jgi:hypothetical protein